MGRARHPVKRKYCLNLGHVADLTGRRQIFRLVYATTHFQRTSQPRPLICCFMLFRGQSEPLPHRHQRPPHKLLIRGFSQRREVSAVTVQPAVPACQFVQRDGPHCSKPILYRANKLFPRDNKPMCGSRLRIMIAGIKRMSVISASRITSGLPAPRKYQDQPRLRPIKSAVLTRSPRSAAASNN